MKKHAVIITILALCLLFAACENTDGVLSSTGFEHSAFNSSFYSPIQDTVQSSSVSETADTESSQAEISSEAPIPSVPSALPQSSSSAPASGETPAITTPSSTPAAPQCTHSYKQTGNTANCKSGGQITYTCALCGNSYTEQTAATGHKWNGHKCSVCGAVDENKMKESLYNWFCANSVAEDYGNYYHLPSDGRYKFSAIGGGNFFFYLDDEEKDEYITISVYGFEKNTCYITYILNGMMIEGEFPMDAVHSTDRNFFNAMYAVGNDAAAKKDELVSALRGKIDGFLKKFEAEMLIPKTDITLKNLGFTCY